MLGNAGRVIAFIGPFGLYLVLRTTVAAIAVAEAEMLLQAGVARENKGQG